jgi:hypothetical protein
VGYPLTGHDIYAHRQYIEAALEYADGAYTFDEVVAMVESGRLQYWPGPSSAVVTEILSYPRKKVLNFFLAGGNLPEIEAMYPGIHHWGRSQGCTHAAMFARPGWARSFVTRTAGYVMSPMRMFETEL